MGLLSTTIHQHTHAAPYPQHIHNAPTTEQVKYLRELEAHARDAAMNARELPGNILGEVVTFRDPSQARSFIVFDLNGQRHKVEIADHMLREPGLLARAAAGRVAEKVCGAILMELVKIKEARQ